MIRLSTGFVQMLAGVLGVRAITNNMVIEVRTGLQPASADDADAGMLLWKATAGAASFVGETLASATCDISNTPTSNPTVFTINGVNVIDLTKLPAFTTISALAASLSAALNASAMNMGFSATVVGNIITIKAPKNSGDQFNATTATITCTGLGGSYAFAGGIAAQNGLELPEPVAGIITYDSEIQVWSGRGVAEGTPQHFRIKCSSGDTGAASTSFARIDGNVAQIGGDMKISVGDVKVGKLQLVEDFKITLNRQ